MVQGSPSLSWAESPEVRAAAMAEAHRARHRAGREARDQRSADTATRLQDKTDERRSHAAWKKRRRAEDREMAALAYRHFRVEVRPEQRPKRPRATSRKSFNHHTSGTGSAVRPSQPGGQLREVFLQWTSRGFGSGREWQSGRKARGQPRPKVWRSGEAHTKVVYITRRDALVEIEGAILSNLGATVAEIGTCFDALEAFERLGRANAIVFYHAIVAIDASLPAASQAAAMAAIVKPLDQAGAGYVASLHKPDPGGDQRNVHVHVVLTLRPVEQLAPYEWSFGVSRLASIDSPAGLRAMRHHIATVMTTSGRRWVERRGGPRNHEPRVASSRRVTPSAVRSRLPAGAPKPPHNVTWIVRRPLPKLRCVADWPTWLIASASLSQNCPGLIAMLPCIAQSRSRSSRVHALE